MNEVRQHQTEGSMWTVLKGRVYNLSPYMKFHPGGRCMMLGYFGFSHLLGYNCSLTALIDWYHRCC